MSIEIKDNPQGGQTVYRDGAAIGTITESTFYGPALGGRVKGAINDAFGSKLTFVLDEAPKLTKEKILAFKAAVEAISIPLGADPPPVETIEAVTLFGLERLTALVESGKIPAPPPTRPDMGDKDPAYVAWFREHATPEEFEAKYRGRKTPTMEEADAGERARRAKLDAEGTFRL